MDVAELPPAPRRYTLSFFLVLFCFVLPLWSSVPLAWVFVVHALHTGRLLHYSYPGKLLFALSFAEVLFSVHHFRLAKHVSGPSPVGRGKLHEIQTAYNRVLKAGLSDLTEGAPDEESLDTSRPGSPAEPIIQLQRDDPRAIDFRHCLRTWFLKVPWSSVKLLHVQQWLYWSIFNADLPPSHELPKTHRTILDEALDLLQKRAGCTFPEGSDPNVTPMRLTIDQVNICWRPLTFYVLVLLSKQYLKWRFVKEHGVSYGSYNNLEYMIRIPANWNCATGPSPIVFLHGLGLGLLQYHMSLSSLLEQFLDRPILVPLQPQISQDFFHPRFLKPMPRHEAADSLAALLLELGWVEDTDIDGGEGDTTPTPDENGLSGVTIVSHSNGSYTHAWMLKSYPHLVFRSCFVDPVTFCSWEGDVCYNFIYRPARTGMELLMRYFVASELGVANTLQRHFDWVSNSLWYEEIPNARNRSKTFFLLGGKDDIIRAERVKKYLKSHGIHKGLWYDPEARHGQALIVNSPGFTEIMRWIQES
ncbi:hypothetical protein AX16_000992 [Volvariella volvacea WC 439]|nr:hypothetical protein AX16_000992 [Volvariella volvacea WC 439]